MRWRPPDPHRIYPEPKRDVHTTWPALPFVLLLVMLAILVLVSCEWLGFI